MGVPVLERAGDQSVVAVDGFEDILVAAAFCPRTVGVEDEIAALGCSVVVDQPGVGDAARAHLTRTRHGRPSCSLDKNELVSVSLVRDHVFDEVARPGALVWSDFAAVAVTAHQIRPRGVMLLDCAIRELARFLIRPVALIGIGGATENLLAPDVTIVWGRADEVTRTVALLGWREPVLCPDECSREVRIRVRVVVELVSVVESEEVAEFVAGNRACRECRCPHRADVVFTRIPRIHAVSTPSGTLHDDVDIGWVVAFSETVAEL